MAKLTSQKPQFQRLTWPPSQSQWEALDAMLEALFRRKPVATTSGSTPQLLVVRGDDGEDGADGMIGPPGPPGSAGSAAIPYFIASGATFTVPLYDQALFSMNIDNEGFIVVDGFLIEVD